MSSSDSNSHFSDDRIAVSNGIYANASLITVTDNLYSVGARVNRHLGSFWIGGGLGYRFGASRHLDAQLLAIVSEQDVPSTAIAS